MHLSTPGDNAIHANESNNAPLLAQAWRYTVQRCVLHIGYAHRCCNDATRIANLRALPELQPIRACRQGASCALLLCWRRRCQLLGAALALLLLHTTREQSPSPLQLSLKVPLLLLRHSPHVPCHQCYLSPFKAIYACIRYCIRTYTHVNQSIISSI